MYKNVGIEWLFVFWVVKELFTRTQRVKYHFYGEKNIIYLLYGHYIYSLCKRTKLALTNYTPSIFVRNLDDHLFRRKLLTPKERRNHIGINFLDGSWL